MVQGDAVILHISIYETTGLLKRLKNIYMEMMDPQALFQYNRYFLKSTKNTFFFSCDFRLYSSIFDEVDNWFRTGRSTDAA